MAEHLHTVEIAGTEGDPAVKFTCHGDAESPCHRYPDCDCEEWPSDETAHIHPYTTHDECWMQPWFDNDCVSPASHAVIGCDLGYQVGMSGPVKTTFEGDFVGWEFIEQEARQ